MALKVHDFYTKEKLSTNGFHNIVMANAVFYILYSVSDKFKELSIQIPKKFHYEKEVNTKDFKTSKATEYNVLVDFIKNNVEGIREKGHLNKEEFKELLEGLYLVLLQRYCTKTLPVKYVTEAFALLKILVNRFMRRIKTCCQE